jgi:hypothetical protein
MTINKYFESTNTKDIKRTCPLCELPLKLEDFKYKNKDEYLSLWNNKKIAILCCNCLRILEKLTNSNVLEIEYPTDRTRAWITLNNLFRLGFITEIMRDTEFKDYMDYLKNLKQKSIMRYFLM